MRIFAVLLCATILYADYRPPAGSRAAVRGPNGSAILPGGRVIHPVGQQFPTGPGPYALVADPSGRLIVTANVGPERASLTVLESSRKEEWSLRNFFAARAGNGSNTDSDFQSLAAGLAFANEHNVWVSEGASGLVRLIDPNASPKKKTLDLNGAGVEGSFSGSLAFDAARNLLFVADETHPRVVVFDVRSGVRAAVAVTTFPPRYLSLAADGRRLWAAGNDAVCVIDVEHRDSPVVLKAIPLSQASGLLATSNAIYVASAREDTITIIDPASSAIRATIPLRIPGLESLRGIIPMGMAFDAGRQLLLVAEAGINAVAVIDTQQDRVLGHMPVGWFPTAVAIRDGVVLVANAQGRGTGPSSVFMMPDEFEFGGTFHRGSVSRFPLPDAAELAGQLAKDTQLGLAANGFAPVRGVPRPAVQIKYVVCIVKEDRSFDDVLGDLKIKGADVAGVPRLAQFGEQGYASGGKGMFSLQSINVTPNLHALARQFSVSDNFYADSESSAEGWRWLTGGYPENDQRGTLWQDLTDHHISFRRFGGPEPPPDGPAYPPGADTPDQIRAAGFIADIENNFVKTARELPQLLYVSLPNDRTARPRRADGFPYAASYVTDNDVALGKIVDYLSHSPWWREMAIFVTEASAQGGRDHIDAHRTVLLGIGPWMRHHYVSHTNASFPSLLKSVLEILGLPPLNLFDASAASVDDMLTAEPDYTPYTAVPCDERLFDPHTARAAHQ